MESNFVKTNNSFFNGSSVPDRGRTSTVQSAATFARACRGGKPRIKGRRSLSDPRLAEKLEYLALTMIMAMYRHGIIREFGEFKSYLKYAAWNNGATLHDKLQLEGRITNAIRIGIYECAECCDQLRMAIVMKMNDPAKVDILLEATRHAVWGFEAAMAAAEFDLAMKPKVSTEKVEAIAKPSMVQSSTCGHPVASHVSPHCEARQTPVQAPIDQRESKPPTQASDALKGSENSSPRLFAGLNQSAEQMLQVLKVCGKFVRPEGNQRYLQQMWDVGMHSEVVLSILRSRGRDTKLLEAALTKYHRVDNKATTALYSHEKDPVVIDALLTDVRDAITEFGVLLAAESRSTASAVSA